MVLLLIFSSLSPADAVVAFQPGDVFHTLYRDSCAQVARLTAQVDRVDGFPLPSEFVNRVMAHLNLLYKEYLKGRPAAAIHLETLRKYACKWVELKTQKTCLVCIRRAPQYAMECGHQVCENCIRVFGKVSTEDPWLFNTEVCFLCQAESRIAVRIHAPTAGVGVLCIDGGGVRGIIPTTVLELLEERIGLPIPVQEHFKLVLGISAGKLTTAS